MSNSVLEKYFGTENLKLAYYRILCWPERLVKDRFGIHAFGAHLDKNLKQLSDKILSSNYSPQRAFKYYEPKSSGTQRTKTLLMIEDAIVYQAIANIIAEKNYLLLSEHGDFVFGSVLMPDVGQGIELLKQENPKYFFLNSGNHCLFDSRTLLSRQSSRIKQLISLKQILQVSLTLYLTTTYS